MDERQLQRERAKNARLRQLLDQMKGIAKEMREVLARDQQAQKDQAKENKSDDVEM